MVFGFAGKEMKMGLLLFVNLGRKRRVQLFSLYFGTLALHYDILWFVKGFLQ